MDEAAQSCTPTHYNNTSNSSLPLPVHEVSQTIQRSNCSPMQFSGGTFHTSSQVILATAIVEVFNKSGKTITCRVLLDSGSQTNFISNDAVKRLGASSKHNSIPIKGINGQLITSTESTQLTIKSRFSSYKQTLKFLMVPKITDRLPIVSIDINTIHIPENIKLADPEFHTPSHIDMLVGAEVYFDLLCIGQIKPTRNGPVLQKTHLGWIISGKILNNTKRDNTALSCYLNITEDLNANLQKFWELEELSTPSSFSKEEMDCENHFNETFSRELNGRFNLRLPFKDNLCQLGNSYNLALKRFSLLEKRFDRHPDLKSDYVDFMREYANLNHMHLLIEDNTNEGFYLPHHPVLKVDSLTTKLRVVFDGSAKSTSNVSLNDTLMKGPTVQDDLISIVLRFRTHNYVLTADIEKMYRQIVINDSDTHFQKILWRERPEDELNTYLLTTVTYGTTSAPFLATRCLRQLAIERANTYPSAAKIVLRDFYVDDLITGCNTMEDAICLHHELTLLLKEGGFSLRKWRTNGTQQIFQHDIAHTKNYIMPWDKLENAKTLGVIWNSENDVFHFSITSNAQSASRITKRQVLSGIAKIFDPLGFLGPVLTIAKLTMQRLWQLKIDWDESLPMAEHTRWVQLQGSLSVINDIQIPRKVTALHSYDHLELHGFCDASENAYGACIYIRVSNDRNQCHSTTLFCSKSKVAPLKSTTLPRLELCAAVLLSRLLSKVKASISHINFDACHLWTDSTIVLAWIAAPSSNWKTFVANRVAEIQQLTQDCQWHHIKTTENPADCLSRGMFPSVLIAHKLWWQGPPWLCSPQQDWPNNMITQNVELVDLEQRKTVCLLAMSFEFTNDIFNNHTNSITKLKRIVAYCLRFINNIKSRTKATGFLTADELSNSLIVLITLVQNQVFSEELTALQNSSKVSKSSRLFSLNPFIDDQGLLRVGGRIKNAELPFDHKHPMVIPAHHKLTEMLINYEHIRMLHGGPQLVLSSLRNKFWPLAGKNTVRRILRKCITCFRNKPTTSYPIMGNLPHCRVNQCRPFINVGVDYAGPIIIKESHRRGRVHTSTCYIALFVCMATKAVHLELVNGLTAQAFIGALKRFMARRGKCSSIYSDNATNFVKANKDLREIEHLHSKTKGSNSVTNFLADIHVNWIFIPARSPTFGGLWEAAIKSMKYHLRRITGNSVFTYEEYLTFLVQVESCLNSRPLTPLSDDPNDLTPLTPAHFLIGDSLTTIPEKNDNGDNSAHWLTRYQLIQRLTQHFWKRWSVEYLARLRLRQKWKGHNDEHIVPGRLVVLKDEATRPLFWKLGRVVQVFPGSDGVVRVVQVKTANGEVRRAVTKVCPLPLETTI